MPHTVSVYSEHDAAGDGTRPSEMGTLHYVGRRLSHQVVPLRGVDQDVREQLLRGGTRLAETYRALEFSARTGRGNRIVTTSQGVRPGLREHLSSD